MAPEGFLLVLQALWLHICSVSALAVQEQPFSQKVAPLVSREVGTPPESFPTIPALIRLLSGVNPLVDEEEGVVLEAFPALAACEGLLRGRAARRDLERSVLAAGGRGPVIRASVEGMLLPTNDQFRPVRQLLRTFAAAVRFLACVGPLMVKESFPPGESLPTLRAQESFLRRGVALGLTAAGGLPPVFAAPVWATELFFLVHSLVAREVGPPPKGFPAFGTFKGLLLGVDPLMLEDIRFTVEGFPALAAVKELLPALVLQMMIQRGAIGERFLTPPGFEIQLTGVGLLVQVVGIQALESFAA